MSKFMRKEDIAKGTLHKMIECAKEARENAFALRSEHKIGASVLTEDGKIFGGCNIESNTSGLGICAERAAVNHAIVNGYFKFKALLIYDEFNLMPCGACLQYMLEFASISGMDVIIMSSDAHNNVSKYKLSYLLPLGYKPKRSYTKTREYRANNPE